MATSGECRKIASSPTLRQVNEARRRRHAADRVFTQFRNSAENPNVANLGTGIMLLLAAGAMSQGRSDVGDSRGSSRTSVG